jgi:hypothetical protein
MSGIVKITPGTLTPSKDELLAAWLPDQPWFDGDAGDLTIVGRYRFVDPDGEVGMETFLVQSKGVTYQVPVTWRAEPLPEAEDFLVGETEHSGIGHRYCYEATIDPVYAVELFRVIHEGDTEAEVPGRGRDVRVQGSGIVRVSNAAGESVRIVRVLDGKHVPPSPVLGTLTGVWKDKGETVEQVLAVIK